MRITKNKIEILKLFKENIFLSCTIRKISILLNKSYPKIYDSLKELEKEGIINIKKVGNSGICEIKLAKESISILSFIEGQEAFSKNIPNIDKILDFEQLFNDIMIVTGSYAKGKQTKTSDIDLAIITNENAFEKQKLIENLTLLFIPEVHVIFFTVNDFKEMLLGKEQNFGKEVFKNHLILRNPERYYLIIKEVIGHGFRG